MAPEKKAGFEDSLEFEVVAETYASPSQTRRRSASVAVSRTGYTESNVNGAEEFLKLITAAGGRFEDKVTMKFGANPAANLIACYLAKDGEPGSSTVRISNDKKTLSFHLGHVFDKHPLLRPAAELSCTVKLGTDKKGTACVIINLKGTAVRKGKAATEAASQAAASEQPT